VCNLRVKTRARRDLFLPQLSGTRSGIWLGGHELPAEPESGYWRRATSGRHPQLCSASWSWPSWTATPV